ncbi:Uncharacterised protein [Vibrio cholerae]|nr:Uncharacterised protein [Vibrio cholerae]CSB73118.1 Uncharacterised protein [Vibrio cholerae]
MNAPCFTVAFEQGLFTGVEKQHADIVVLLELVEYILYQAWLFGQIADINANRHVLLTALNRLDKGCQQADGQVIDTVVTKVFEYSKSDALTGSRLSADHDQTHTVCLLLVNHDVVQLLIAGCVTKLFEDLFIVEAFCHASEGF